MALLHRSGARIFNFHDDNFFPLAPEQRWQRVRKLKDALDQRGLDDIAFAIKSRPDAVDEELFRFLPIYTLFAGAIGFAIGWIVGRKNV